MSAIAIFSAESTAVSFVTKAGASQTMDVHGALWKGGVAFNALKDLALVSALQKAENGRYRPAADVLAAAWPSVAKAAEKFLGNPWGTKAAFVAFVVAVEADKGGKKGYNKKQEALRPFVMSLASALLTKQNGPVVSNADGSTVAAS